MRKMLVLAALILGIHTAFGQVYKPKPGETDLKISIEGRGDIYIKLYTAQAPKTVAHIEKLVKSGFYNGLRFHRVDKIPKPYLVQVGDPESRVAQKDTDPVSSVGSGTTVPYEDSGHQNIAGAVGLAHSVQDKNSGDSEFYILLGPSMFLNGHYTVFGEVVSGMSIVNKIALDDEIKAASIVKG